MDEEKGDQETQRNIQDTDRRVVKPGETINTADQCMTKDDLIPQSIIQQPSNRMNETGKSWFGYTIVLGQ